MAAEIVSSSFSSHKYDLFLSFRGLDTRKSFTSHLYTALCREKILAYIDHQLKSGEEISSTLVTTIEESKLSLVIFSKNYAKSRWCLDELVHIIKCKEERNHIVFLVFYGVEPSDVRHQKGTYADSFLKLEKRFNKNPVNTAKLQQWRKALTAAANLSGFELKHNE